MKYEDLIDGQLYYEIANEVGMNGRILFTMFWGDGKDYIVFDKFVDEALEVSEIHHNMTQVVWDGSISVLGKLQSADKERTYQLINFLFGKVVI